MKIDFLELSNYKMYNSVTGDVIVDESCEEGAASLIAYWVDECFNEPMIKDEVLKATWESFVEKFEMEQEDSPFMEELDQFILDHDSASWIAYEITTCGLAFGPASNTVLFIVDKNVIVEELEEEEDDSPVS